MSLTLDHPLNVTTEAQQTGFLWLDITRTCQANCNHCYNHSGPQGTAGEMTLEEWLSVLNQGCELGVRRVQFIGGEPTLHPHLPELMNHAVDRGLRVEIFSNLILIRSSLWPLLRQRGVTLATSYYSDQAAEHEEITRHRGSYAKTKANIQRAISYGIPLRAGIIEVLDGQRVDEARAELHSLGVRRIHTDRQRDIGRAAGGDGSIKNLVELCGNCAHRRAAILPSG